MQLDESTQSEGGSHPPPTGMELWVLAGQSNMEGYGILPAEPSRADVWSLSTAGHWEKAQDPLHRLWESFTPVHQRFLREYQGHDHPYSALSDEEAAREDRANRHSGAGLGVSFAKILSERTGRPVGLVPVAHGGTRLSDWEPDRRDTQGESFYGAMLLRIARALEAPGATLGGVLWYQGESDATDDLSKTYSDRFAAWVASLRNDLNRPDLLVATVQLGRLIATTTILDYEFSARGWNTIREAQRRMPERLTHLLVTSAVDLRVTDEIHLETSELARLGTRLSRLVLGGPSPDITSIRRGQPLPNGKPTLELSFDGMTSGWSSTGRITGFAVTDAFGAPHPSVKLIDGWSSGPNGQLTVSLTGDADDLHLSYGMGFDPRAMLTDTDDNPLLAFGPLPVAE